MNCKQEKAFPVAERFRQESLLTTQTATDLRGICGNDRLKKCWKANETEQKRTQTNGKNHKKFQIPVGKDEVGGSNPPSSSKEKSCSFKDYKAFSFCFLNCFPLNFPFSAFGMAFSAWIRYNKLRKLNRR